MKNLWLTALGLSLIATGAVALDKTINFDINYVNVDTQWDINYDIDIEHSIDWTDSNIFGKRGRLSPGQNLSFKTFTTLYERHFFSLFNTHVHNALTSAVFGIIVSRNDDGDSIFAKIISNHKIVSYCVIDKIDPKLSNTNIKIDVNFGSDSNKDDMKCKLLP